MERLYYVDSLLTSFSAAVLACDAADGLWRVKLDRTAFYPTSGGQPFDTGTLGDARVVDVIDDDNGDVIHLVDGAIEVGGAVRGEIDWPRRLDHMQQHTGQHMLSAAFDRLCGVRTVSFHLGTQTATIDLAREVTRAEIDRAEAEANRVVWENRPVSVRFVTPDEASRLPLRKDPARTGELRLVEVADFDLSACGGTHVPLTGMVGIIAVSGWERFKGATRLTFVCGGRALASCDALRDVVAEATRVLSVTPPEVAATIARLRDEVAASSRVIRRQQEQLAAYRAVELRQAAETIGAYRGVLRAELGQDAASLKSLASAVVAGPGLVVVLTGDGTPTPVVVMRSDGVEFDAAGWMRAALAALGGRGGGRPEAAQGGLSATSEEILAFARETLRG